MTLFSHMFWHCSQGCVSQSAAPNVYRVLSPLETLQVQIEMLMSGLCHTDIHMQKNDW